MRDTTGLELMRMTAHGLYSASVAGGRPRLLDYSEPEATRFEKPSAFIQDAPAEHEHRRQRLELAVAAPAPDIFP